MNIRKWTTYLRSHIGNVWHSAKPTATYNKVQQTYYTHTYTKTDKWYAINGFH